MVYDVKMQDWSKVADFEVDAANGKVLAQETGNSETNDDTEGPAPDR